MKLPKPWFRKSSNAYYLTLNGQQIRLGTTKEEADEAYRTLLFERGLNSVSKSKVTMRQLIDEYWAWAKSRCAHSTVDRRRPLVNSLWNFVPAALLAEDVNPILIDRWIETFDARSPSTVATRQTLASTILNWGVRMGMLSRNPLANMPRARARIRQDFLDAETVARVIKAAPNQEAHDLIVFLADTGARPQEAFKAQACHLQGDKLVWPIWDSKGQRSSRVIYLPERALAVVRRLAAAHPHGPLFRAPTGSAWNKENTKRMLHQVRDDVGLKTLCATMFRHSFAHHRLAAGQDAAVVAKLMGHVSTDMVFKRYGHLDQGNILAEAVAAVPSLSQASQAGSSAAPSARG